MNIRKLKTPAPLLLVMALTVSLRAQTPSDPADLPQRDGSHDFDFSRYGGKTWEVNSICELSR